MTVAIVAAYLTYEVAVAVGYFANEGCCCGLPCVWMLLLLTLRLKVAVAYLAYIGSCCLPCVWRLLMWQLTLRMKVAVVAYLAYEGCCCGRIPCVRRLLMWQLTLRMKVASVAYLAYECCCCLPCVWRLLLLLTLRMKVDVVFGSRFFLLPRDNRSCRQSKKGCGAWNTDNIRWVHAYSPILTLLVNILVRGFSHSNIVSFPTENLLTIYL